jgi:hypothetical protein
MLMFVGGAASVYTRNRPFDMLFCVGNFFEKPKAMHMADLSAAVAHQQLNEYISGFKRGATDNVKTRIKRASCDSAYSNVFYHWT